MDYGAKVRAAGVAAAGGLARLQGRHPQSNQGVCADAIAAIEGISRADLEAFGVESQRRDRNQRESLRQVDRAGAR